MQQLPRVHMPDPATFLAEYVAKRQPVVLTGVMAGWKALSSWTLEHLKSALPNRKVQAVTLPQGHFDGTVEQQPELRDFEFANFIEAIAHPETVGGRIYNLHSGMSGELAPLKEDIGLPPYFPPESLYESLFIAGPRDYVVRAHYDVPNNLLAQLHGRKRVVLFPPDELYRMYPYPAYTRSPHFTQVDIERPDPRQHPRFRLDRARETVLEPGEMLYIPSCWWHQISYLTPTVGVNFFYKLPITQMLRLNVLRCVGMVLHRPELRGILGRKKPASGKLQRPDAQQPLQ
jgi:hypothetical protein